MSVHLSQKRDHAHQGRLVDIAPITDEAPPPEVTPGEAAEDRSAFALFSVFRHRNYRLFYSGQVISLVGNWITHVAQGWLVYSLTQSPLLLAVVAFASHIPVFFLSPFGGMVSDRFDRRRILIITQSLAMLESLGLATLTLTGTIEVWHVVVLAAFQGVVNAFDVPARQAMTLEMVGRSDLRHAISLNSMIFNLARMVGPAIAGLLIAVAGVGICFAIDALSYLAVIVSLLAMRFSPRPLYEHEAPLRAIRQGFAYAWGKREIRVSLMLVALCSAFGGSYIPLLPAMAREVLHQGSVGLGYLYGAVGIGALMGAYVLARVPDRHLFLTPLAASFCFGLSLMGFSLSHWYPLSFALLMPCSFSLMLLGGSTNSLIQLLSRDDMRGRVVSLYEMGFIGMMPWGSLLLGGVAEHFGTGRAITLGGLVCALVAIWAYLDRRGEKWSLHATA